MASVRSASLPSRARNKMEALFSELQNQIGLRGLRLRNPRCAGEQFLSAATAQNLKRLILFLKHSKELKVEIA